MNFKTTIALIFSSLLVCACSVVTHQQAIDEYQNAKICCKDMAEFKYYNLSATELYVVDINESSQFFGFSSGKSYFIGVTLPRYKEAYKVKIKSYVIGMHVDKSYVFSPKILILDENYSVISESNQEQFDFVKASLSDTANENIMGLPLKLEGSIVIEHQNARHIVVLTTDTLLSGSTPHFALRAIPIILPGIVGAIPTHREPVKIPHSPFGRLVVAIDDL